MEQIPYLPDGITADEVSCCLSWIRKLARTFDMLPRSLTLHGVKKAEDHPCGGGGYADIYKGTYDGKLVALKVIRATVTESFRRRIHKVSQKP